MQRYFLIFVIGTIISFGCAARIPVAPETGMPGPQNQRASSSDDPHRLWMEAKIFINEAHDRVDVVPQRETRFHLNALKFLESYCTDCLKITQIKNNGDGTIDLTVKITHPFKGFPQYTGFDVKGIIMFNGSHELLPGLEAKYGVIDLPYPITRVSWRELGDPQVLNADGYVRRWSLSYDSGSSRPILNYWKGKYTTGEPTADVNAYLDFYSDETRHMFRSDAVVSRSYKIWLPPGPLTAGYAVEACWEPPTVMPVIDPIVDFPSSANQPEPYHLKWILNNEEPIKYMGGCCEGNHDCSDLKLQMKHWGGVINADGYPYYAWIITSEGYEANTYLYSCEPQQGDILTPAAFFVGTSDLVQPGKHQWLAVNAEQTGVDEYINFSFDLLEFTVLE